MKNILLVGNTENINTMIHKILLLNKSTYVHEKTFFDAIKTLYRKKVDTIIVSSKELKNQKMDFIGFLRNSFSSSRILVSYDNGFNGLKTLPETISVITPDDLETEEL